MGRVIKAKEKMRRTRRRNIEFVLFRNIWFGRGHIENRETNFWEQKWGFPISKMGKENAEKVSIFGKINPFPFFPILKADFPHF